MAFDGFDDPPESGDGRFHNLFFALYPDAETADRTAGVAEHYRWRNGLTSSLMPRERLHVTLNNLGGDGRLSAPLIDKARQVADAVRMAPFVVDMNRI